MKIHVSKMSGKLKGFRAVNFNPLTSTFCRSMHAKGGGICEHCYSFRMISTYRKSCAKPFTANAELMSGAMPPEGFVGFDPGEHVRLLAHGDMDNKEQYINFVKLCEYNPGAQFTMWTKRKDIVLRYLSLKPHNLTIIQSSSQINTPEPIAPGFDAVFTVYDDETLIKVPSTRCYGKSCASCMYCYTKPAGHISELLRK